MCFPRYHEKEVDFLYDDPELQKDDDQSTRVKQHSPGNSCDGEHRKLLLMKASTTGFRILGSRAILIVIAYFLLVLLTYCDCEPGFMEAFNSSEFLCSPSQLLPGECCFTLVFSGRHLSEVRGHHTGNRPPSRDSAENMSEIILVDNCTESHTHRNHVKEKQSKKCQHSLL